jgi:hypothetical protein
MGKRKSLSFEAKIKIIEESEKRLPKKDLSLKHGVSKSVISVTHTDHNLPLTREIINIKAKVFAEKLGNEP